MPKKILLVGHCGADSAYLRLAVKKAAGDPEKVKDTRALLAPLLRDTLLAFNYAHYAPP